MRTYIPIELVIIGLGSVVEQNLISCKCFAKNSHHVFVLKLGTLDHVSCSGNILCVMLIVMKSEGFLTNMRLKCRVSVGKIRKYYTLV
jgi:hypothetical protein